MTPAAVSRPNALPPDSTIAWSRVSDAAGSSRSVPIVPGAPPRTSTPATAPAGQHDRAAGRPLGERVVADLDRRPPT